MNADLERQSGSALILALIAALMLMIVSFEVLHTSRIEGFIAQNIEIDAQLEVACRAGLERALARLREDRQQTEIDSQNDVWYGLYVDTELIEADVAGEEFMAQDDYEGEEGERETRLYIETFDEAAKYNVYMLLNDDNQVSRDRRERFGNLIDYYRDEFETDLATSDGTEIANEIASFLRRSSERPYQGMEAVPTKQEGTLLDLSELLHVRGVMPSRMWDYIDEDGNTIVPGLWRYLTVWSDLQVNINTAEIPVLASLFTRDEAFLAERIVDFRNEDAEEKERTAGRFSETGTFGDGDETEDPTGGAPFTQINELREKVEGINQETYNKISPYLTVQSSVFSIVVTAERGLVRRSKMWVVRRTPDGFRILLERPVDFPYFLDDEQLEEAEERSAEEF